jgi:serine O-acetyltransferase
MNKAELLMSCYRLPLVRTVAYHLLTMMGVNLPLACTLGPGVRLEHGAAGLVVHEATRIGAGVKLYQGVTIGRSDVWADAGRTLAGGGVVIGEGAVIGAGAAVLFASGSTVTVGERAVIGANAVVTQDVPAGEIWAGIPARKVRHRDD